jgi:sporulation protein YlmC with PRC-barrel domain
MAHVIDAHLHLLDRQVIDRDGMLVGKVDDLELELRPGAAYPVVSAILCGPMALGPRVGGRLGVWIVAIGRRLRPRGDNDPVRIGFGAVTELGPSIKLSISVDQAPTMRLEQWCLDKVILRLPGGNRETG